MRWLSTQPSADPAGDSCSKPSCIIYSDSLYAVNMILGKSKARVNIPLIHPLKKMYAELLATFTMSLKWTKGHSKAGTAAAHWNHVVDRLAAEGASPPPSLPP